MKTVELAPFGIALREAIDASPFKNRSAFLAAAGTQPPVLYRYETGEQSPRLDQITEWAQLLGCAPDRLVPFMRRESLAEGGASADANPELEEFLQSDFGKQITPEERATLELLLARHGRPKGVETYYSLISLLRTGFTDAAEPVGYADSRTQPRPKAVPHSQDRALRPKRVKKRSSPGR